MSLLTEIYHLCSTHKIFGCLLYPGKTTPMLKLELAYNRLVLPQVMARGIVCIICCKLNPFFLGCRLTATATTGGAATTEYEW